MRSRLARMEISLLSCLYPEKDDTELAQVVDMKWPVCRHSRVAGIGEQSKAKRGTDAHGPA